MSKFKSIYDDAIGVAKEVMALYLEAKEECLNV